MKIWNNNVSIVYMVYAFSIIADHITTRLGLTLFGLTEANFVTFYLIQNGLWIIYDLGMFILSFTLIYYIIEKTNYGNDYLLGLPLSVGVFRGFAAIYNVMLMMI